MKKYWKSIAAVLVIVLGIGTYYMHSAIEARSLPGISIQTLEGDESLIDSIVIRGFYRDKTNEEFFNLTSDGYLYRESLSLINQLKGVPDSYELGLRDRYSKLLRRTKYMSYRLFENEQHAALAFIDYNAHRIYPTMEVRVLDKQTNKMSSMTHLFDDSTNRQIDKIQLVNDEILVFSSGLNYERNQVNQVIEVLRFDAESGRFSEKEVLLSAASDNVSVSKLEETPHWRPNDYVVYRKKGDGAKADLNELYAYNVAEGDFQPIELPEHLQTQNANWIDGTNIYFADFIDNRVDITVFHIPDGDVLTELSIEHVSSPSEAHIITVANGYVYALDSRSDENVTAKLSVYEVESGNLIYQGEIVREDSNSYEDKYRLELYQLNFKN